ncbi:MAG: DUF4013 domain-containing protein [Chloroflexaceae bacterium]|nr:DUF4013 domain-containing protein [Chloroflexaceae bacterium]
MDIGRAFSFVTEDEKWIMKVLIGGLVSLIPILGTLAGMGYMFTVARNVYQGQSQPLPSWDEFGQFLMRGLYAFVISLIYSIPLIILIFVPMLIILPLAGGSGSEDAAGAMVFLALCLNLFILVISVVWSVLIYVAFVRYVQTDSLGDALNFGKVFSMLQASLGTWVLLIVGIILASLASMIGLIGCGIGVIFTIFYAYIVMGHMMGQVARKTDTSMGMML